MKYKTNPSLAGQLRHLHANDDIAAFQRLLQKLANRKDQGRASRYLEPETVHMRMAIACAPPEHVTVLLGQWDEGVFYIATRMETRCGMLRSSWVIDDEILRERARAAGEPDHPAHSTVCLTDLFNRAEEIDVARFEALESGRQG